MIVCVLIPDSLLVLSCSVYTVQEQGLAWRNILVDEGKLLKISDFGLSRDTPEYVSSLQDKMPLRWMAPETVTENVFTDKSDV